MSDLPYRSAVETAVVNRKSRIDQAVDHLFKDPAYVARVTSRALLPWVAGIPLIAAAALYQIGWSYKNAFGNLTGFPGEAIDWPFAVTVARGYDVSASTWHGALLWSLVLLTFLLPIFLAIALPVLVSLPQGWRDKLSHFFAKLARRRLHVLIYPAKRIGRLKPVFANLWTTMLIGLLLLNVVFGSATVAPQKALARWQTADLLVRQGCGGECREYALARGVTITGVPIVADSKQLVLWTGSGAYRLPHDRIERVSRAAYSTSRPVGKSAPR